MPLRNRWLCIPTLQGGESQSRVGELWGLVVFIVLPDCLPGSAPIWFGLTADCQSQRVGGLPVFLLFVRATLPFLKKLLPDNPLPSIPCPLERKGCTALNELRSWLAAQSLRESRCSRASIRELLPSRAGKQVKPVVHKKVLRPKVTPS